MSRLLAKTSKTQVQSHGINYLGDEVMKVLWV